MGRHQPGRQEPGAQRQVAARVAPCPAVTRPDARRPRTGAQRLRGPAPRPYHGRRPGSGTRRPRPAASGRRPRRRETGPRTRAAIGAARPSHPPPTRSGTTCSTAGTRGMSHSRENPPGPRRGSDEPGAQPPLAQLPRSRRRPSRKGPGLSPAPRRRPPSGALPEAGAVGRAPARQAGVHERLAAAGLESLGLLGAGRRPLLLRRQRLLGSGHAGDAERRGHPAAVRMSVRLRTSSASSPGLVPSGAGTTGPVSPGFRQCGSASTSRCRRCARRAGIR